MLFGSRRGAWRIWLFIGLSLCLYGYYQWSELKIPSDEALEQAIEAQYQAEIAQLRQQAGETPIEITPEWQDKFRTAIHNERTAPIEKAKKRIQSTVGMGLLLIVLAAGMFVLSYLSEKQKSPGTGT